MMEYGVYLESSIVDLKPRVLDFLTKLVEKAKEMKEYAVAFKKKDLAEITGKDIRTTARYLKELEERNVITTRGVRGRAGGTVILFNAELIRFDTSDKAFINSEEPISIDDIVEQKLPKKQQDPEDPNRRKRGRRSKQEMIVARALEDKKKSEIDLINDELEKLGGTPNWAWFQLTNDPVGNYKTYLVSRLYNRYAALAINDHNAQVDCGFADVKTKVKPITNDYDVLYERFYGTSRWNKFAEVRDFCEENGVHPNVYLSAQFNRSVFEAASKNNDSLKMPHVNGLISDTAYDNFLQYVSYQKNSNTYRTFQRIPAKFVEDFGIRAISEAYESAQNGIGLLQYRGTIKDFFKRVGFGEQEDALLDFYNFTFDQLEDQKVSFKTRDTIKKFIMLQSLILTSGIQALPEYVIFGSEMTQVLLASIDKMVDSREALLKKERALGALAFPKKSLAEIEKEGKTLYTRMTTLYETPKVLRLIMERKGLALSLADLNAAFREYGKEKIPLDDYSMLDVNQIVEVMQKGKKVEESEDYMELVQKREWQLEQSIANEDNLEKLLRDL